MRSKAAFIVGTGLGYVLGARAGRQRFETIAAAGRRAWQDPRVQAKVGDLEAKAADLAKAEVSVLKDKVAGSVKSAVGSAVGSARGTGSGDGGPTQDSSPAATI